MYVYDLVTMAWTDLSTPASGIPPSARVWHGFMAVGGRFYVHGGQTDIKIQGMGAEERNII